MQNFTAKVVVGILVGLTMAFLVNAEASEEPINPSLNTYMLASSMYEAGKHQEAYNKFLTSARWGNKLAQFNLGTMHQNGQGTVKDQAQAWAWVQLSAERDYAGLRDIADDLFEQLSPTEQARARRIFNEELAPEFGDAAVLPRVQRHLDRRYRAATGSRLGGSSSTPLVVQPRDEQQSVGDVYYAQDRWQVDSWLREERRWFYAMTNREIDIVEHDDP